MQRKMITILLWSIVLLFSFHLAGHLHNMLANMPNWSSGSIEDMNRYGNFYHKATNTRFFAPVIFISVIVCILSLFFVWNQNGFTRNMVLLDLFIAMATLVAVLTVFRPMNEYFALQQYDPILLKSMVSRWIMYNYIRFFMILTGLVAAIWNLNAYKNLAGH
jgi:hypothetical protein